MPAQAPDERAQPPPGVQFPEEVMQYFARKAEHERRPPAQPGQQAQGRPQQEQPLEQTAENLRRLKERMEVIAERYAVPPKDIEFDIFEELDQLYIRIRDMRTKEILTTRPAEDFLELKGRINRTIGVFLEELV